MPVAGSCKIVISGSLPHGEIWSTSFGLVNTGVTSQASLQTVVNNMKTAAEQAGSFVSIFGPYNASTTTTNLITGYYYAGGPTATYQANTVFSHAGSQATNALPNQCCVVTTLLTGRPGRSYRGRMYLPLTGPGLTAGQLSSSDCTTIATGMKTFFDAINGGAGGYSVAVISSRQSAMTSVVAVRVDSIVDTQRRRTQSSTPLAAVTVNL